MLDQLIVIIQSNTGKTVFFDRGGYIICDRSQVRGWTLQEKESAKTRAKQLQDTLHLDDKVTVGHR